MVKNEFKSEAQTMRRFGAVISEPLTFKNVALVFSIGIYLSLSVPASIALPQASSTLSTESSIRRNYQLLPALSLTGKNIFVSRNICRDVQKAINENYKGGTNSSTQDSRVDFTIQSDGSVRDVSVYNSCGETTIDNAIVDSIKSERKLAAFGHPYTLIAVLASQSNTISIEPFPSIDWAGYVKKLDQNLKKHWHPPISNTSKKSSVILRIMNDGKIVNVHFDQLSGEPAFDQAVKYAVSVVTPLQLPADAPDSVDIAFQFAYNVGLPSSSPRSKKSYTHGHSFEQGSRCTQRRM